jgi:WD40 repeat protein
VRAMRIKQGRSFSLIATRRSLLTASLRDAATGMEIGVLRGHKNYVTSAAFSPDDTRVVTASFDRTVCIWTFSPPRRRNVRTLHLF